jgi:hypothetical protein
MADHDTFEKSVRQLTLTHLQRRPREPRGAQTELSPSQGYFFIFQYTRALGILASSQNQILGSNVPGNKENEQ